MSSTGTDGNKKGIEEFVMGQRTKGSTRAPNETELTAERRFSQRGQTP